MESFLEMLMNKDMSLFYYCYNIKYSEQKIYIFNK